MPIQWIVVTGLMALAALLTLFFNRGDSAAWKGLKFLGVLVSTVPIVGILQGLLLRTKSKGYSDACFIQAAAGIAAYFLLRDVFHVVS